MATMLTAEIAVQAYRGSIADFRVCRHEASHAAISHLISDPPVLEMWVDDLGNGEMRNQPRDVPGRPEPAEPIEVVGPRLRAEYPSGMRSVLGRRIATLLAGIEADQHTGYMDWTCSVDDRDNLYRIAEVAVGRKARDGFVASIRGIVKLAVHDSWSGLIVPLSLILQDQRYLPGPFINAFLASQPGSASLRSHYSAPFEWQPQAGTR